MKIKNPKITIITCTYNCDKKNLLTSIASVKRQTYQNIEHLFMDGGSTNGTLDAIKSCYENPVLVSEPDRGLYDAFNKGLKLATGDVVGFLHADDELYDERAIERIADAFKNNDIDYYCSRMIIFDALMQKSFAELGSKPHQQTLKDQLYSSNYFAHPTCYCRRETALAVGDFDLHYKVAADIDWLYRLEKNTDKFYFDSNPLIKFRGEGGTSAGNYFTGLREEFAIRKKMFGLSLELLLVYGYHFVRRGIRFILEKFGLLAIIGVCRNLIAKTNNKRLNLG